MGRKGVTLLLVAFLMCNKDCEGVESNNCLKLMSTGLFQVDAWSHLIIRYFTKPSFLSLRHISSGRCLINQKFIFCCTKNHWKTWDFCSSEESLKKMCSGMWRRVVWLPHHGHTTSRSRRSNVCWRSVQQICRSVGLTSLTRRCWDRRLFLFVSRMSRKFGTRRRNVSPSLD